MYISKGGTDLNTLDGLRQTREAIMSLPETPGCHCGGYAAPFLWAMKTAPRMPKPCLMPVAICRLSSAGAVILVHHTGVSDEAQHRARGLVKPGAGPLDIEISVVPGGEGFSDADHLPEDEPTTGTVQPMQSNIAGVLLERWFDEDGG